MKVKGQGRFDIGILRNLYEGNIFFLLIILC